MPTNFSSANFLTGVTYHAKETFVRFNNAAFEVPEERSDHVRFKEDPQTTFAAPQGLFGTLAVADVAEINGEPVGIGIGVNVHPDIEGAIELLKMDSVAGFNGPLIVFAEGVGAGKQIPNNPPEQFGGRPAQQPLSLGIEIDKSPLTVQGQKGVGDAAQDGFVTGMGSAEGLLGVFRFRDVPHGPNATHRATIQTVPFKIGFAINRDPSKFS